jgi:peptidoglycan/LPS O-acetylase OafA/YrhL
MVAPLFVLAFVPGLDVGYVWVSALAPVLAVPLVWSACHDGSFLSWSPLRFLGGRSYGLYLWHWPVVVILSSAGPMPLTLIVVGVALSLLLAELSWRCVERPCLRLDYRRLADGWLAVGGAATILRRWTVAHAPGHHV